MAGILSNNYGQLIFNALSGVCFRGGGGGGGGGGGFTRLFGFNSFIRLLKIKFI